MPTPDTEERIDAVRYIHNDRLAREYETKDSILAHAMWLCDEVEQLQAALQIKTSTTTTALEFMTDKYAEVAKERNTMLAACGGLVNAYNNGANLDPAYDDTGEINELWDNAESAIAQARQEPATPCFTCEGSGKDGRFVEGMPEHLRECPRCHGTGQEPGEVSDAQSS